VVNAVIVPFDWIDSTRVTMEILIDAGKDSGKYSVENPE
jgi:hypothetical protein